MKQSHLTDREKKPVLGRIKVGLIGLSPGAGVSFLTSVLAGFLADVFHANPAVLELGNPCLYEAIGLFRHFPEGKLRFYSQELVEGESPRAFQNRYAGINWLVRSPNETDWEQRFGQELRLVNNGEGDFILCDLSGFTKEEALWQLLFEMDQVILVADPLPSRLLMGQAFLEQLREKRMEPILLINKDNKGVRHRDLKRFFAKEALIHIPFLPPEPIYRAEYGCKLPFRVAELAQLIEEPISSLCRLLIAKWEG